MSNGSMWSRDQNAENKQEELPKTASFMNRIRTTFDLDLLKDSIYLNVSLGCSFFYVAETNFKLMTPFFLSSIGKFYLKNSIYTDTISTVAKNVHCQIHEFLFCAVKIRVKQFSDFFVQTYMYIYFCLCFNKSRPVFTAKFFMLHFCITFKSPLTSDWSNIVGDFVNRKDIDVYKHSCYDTALSGVTWTARRNLTIDRNDQSRSCILPVPDRVRRYPCQVVTANALR